MRNFKTFIALAVLYLLLWFPQHAEAIQSDSLTTKAFVFTYPDAHIEDQKILSGQLESYFLGEASISDVPKGSILWIKMNIVNNTSSSAWVVTFDPSVLYATIYTGALSKSTGTYVPMSERDIKTGENSVRLELGQNSTHTLYIKIESKNGFNAVPDLQFTPFNAWQKNYLLSKANFNLKLGIFLGVSIFIGIALVFFFLNTKDRSYLYYALYLLFAALYTMGGFGYIWYVIGEIPNTFWVIESFILISCYFSFFKFLQHYFSLEVKYPVWYKVFKGIYTLLILMFVSRIFLPEVDVIRSLILASVLLVTIGFFVYLIFKKNPIVMYVFGGTMAFALSLLTAILLHNLGVQFFLDFNDLAMFGIVTQIVLFSIGLANRMKIVLAESQKAKDAFISQLEENQRIQKEINEQLEKKVKLRTKEISNQKEEIQEKAKELEKVNEEVRLMNENLELEVQKRTEHIKLQNKKLIDYAFRNAHHIRGPLARILGLLHLIQVDKDDSELQKFYIERLEESAKELDTSIKKSSKLLEEEDTLSVDTSQK